MKFKCMNCKWNGDVIELTKVPPSRLAGKCPRCGYDVIKDVILVEVEEKKEEPKLEMDLNKDGVEDEEDVKLAAKTTRKLGSLLKKKPKARKGRK